MKGYNYTRGYNLASDRGEPTEADRQNEDFKKGYNAYRRAAKSLYPRSEFLGSKRKSAYYDDSAGRTHGD